MKTSESVLRRLLLAQHVVELHGLFVELRTLGVVLGRLVPFQELAELGQPVVRLAAGRAGAERPGIGHQRFVAAVFEHLRVVLRVLALVILLTIHVFHPPGDGGAAVEGVGDGRQLGHLDAEALGVALGEALAGEPVLGARLGHGALLGLDRLDEHGPRFRRHADHTDGERTPRIHVALGERQHFSRQQVASHTVVARLQLDGSLLHGQAAALGDGLHVMHLHFNSPRLQRTRTLRLQDLIQCTVDKGDDGR